MMEDALIHPRIGPNESAIGPIVTMVAMDRDVPLVRKAAGMNGRADRHICASPLFESAEGPLVLVGPMMGAPYAVMVLEKLIALGAKKVLFLGWCGSFQSEIKIGDIIIPTGASVGEGTTPYYSDNRQPRSSPAVTDVIARSCRKAGRHFHKGLIWSTDAPYRETKDTILSFRNAGVLGVDMETSALFTVARYRGIDLGALLMVSDELASLTWKPGFSSHVLRETRQAAAHIVTDVCRDLSVKENR